MKFGKFWMPVISLLAMAAFTTGCDEKEKDTTLPSVTLSPATLSYEQVSSSQTVQISASRDWTATTEASWIAIEPSSGTASTSPQTITITVLSNTGYDRTGAVVFDIGFDKKTLSVSQEGELGQKAPGDGTLANPYTVADAIEIIANGEYTTEKVYVQGIISSIKEVDTSYGNATYFISDDGTTTNEFEIYRGYYLGNVKFTSEDQIKVGDEVIVYGALTLYNSTKEMTQGNYIYSLNGETSGGSPIDFTDDGTTGTKDDPYTVNKAQYLINNSLNDPDALVYVKGIISSISDVSTSYGNATYNISDDGTTTGQFLIYRGYYLGGDKFTSEDQIKVGDEVIIYGKLVMYNSTPEMTQGNYIYSLNGETSGGSSSGDHTSDGTTGTVDDPYTVNQVLYLMENGLNDESAQVYVKGKISQIKEVSTSYGNASYYISDDGSTTDQYYIYRGYYLGNVKFTSEDQIKVGDEVVIYGRLITYNSTYEMAQGNYIYSLNGTSSGGSESGGSHTSDGTTGTVNDPYTVNQVLYLMENSLNDENAQVYVKGKISQIKEVSTSYGNATYYISDDGSTTDQYYIYRGYYLGNVKFTSEDQIKVGDEVVIYGKLITYSSTYEMAQGNYIYSLNGSSSSGGSETTGSHTDDGTSGTVSDPYSVNKVLYLMENSKNDENTEVYVKGKISQIKEVSTSYGNATYYISDDGSTDDQYYIYHGYYLEGAKFTSEDQIKVGDEVVIYGKLVTYKSTYEMAQGNYIYSLNSSSTGGDDDDDTETTTTTFSVNSSAQTWSSASDDTYGDGYTSTTDGFTVSYYKYNSSNNAVKAKTDHIRVPKNGAMVISAPSGTTMKKIVLTTTESQYCLDMTNTNGSTIATASTGDLTITWSGSSSEFVGIASNGSVRITEIAISYK